VTLVFYSAFNSRDTCETSHVSDYPCQVVCVIYIPMAFLLYPPSPITFFVSQTYFTIHERSGSMEITHIFSGIYARLFTKNSLAFFDLYPGILYTISK